MTRKRKTKHFSKVSKSEGIPVLNADAAGVDIGANEIYVAVPADRDPQSVRCFGTFTAELMQLAAWMRRCRIDTVAMEATGVCWIPAYQILDAAGLRVCLVNARYFQNVPGRKTDVSDCQWLQRLHAAGLLRNSFRPVRCSDCETYGCSKFVPHTVVIARNDAKVIVGGASSPCLKSRNIWY